MRQNPIDINRLFPDRKEGVSELTLEIALAITGILLELFSFLVLVYELFFPWDYKKWKEKHYDRDYGPNKEMHERAKKKGLLSLTLLVVGLTLQAISLLI
jgi:hypothetical protein